MAARQGACCMNWKLILGLLTAWSAVIIVAWSVYHIWTEWLSTGDDVKRYRNPWDRHDT